MQLVANVLVGLVALIHLYIVVLEMALWTTKRGQQVFGLTPEFAKEREGDGRSRRQPGPVQRVPGRGTGLRARSRRPGRVRVHRLLPDLRHRRRCVRGRHSQQADPVRPGRTGRSRPGRHAPRALNRRSGRCPPPPSTRSRVWRPSSPRTAGCRWWTPWGRAARYLWCVPRGQGAGNVDRRAGG